MGDNVRLLREPDALVAPVRFDERDVETEQGPASEAPADERAGKRIGRTYPTAPHLDSTPSTTDFEVHDSIADGRTASVTQLRCIWSRPALTSL